MDKERKSMFPIPLNTRYSLIMDTKCVLKIVGLGETLIKVNLLPMCVFIFKSEKS